MAKEKDKEKNMLVGVVWSCAEMKLILTALFFLCSLATILQIFPTKTFLSPLDLRSCLSKLSTTSDPPNPSPPLNLSSPQNPSPPLNLSTPQNPPTPQISIKQQEQETILNTSLIKRAFNPYGSASYLFIQMGAYRGGLNTFAIIGLASKPLHIFGKPQFNCEWIPANSSESVTVSGNKILPDWGYGRVYTVVVVNCTFPVNVGADRSGGKLVLHALTSGDPKDATEELIPALIEEPGGLNPAIFTAPPKYDYLYCGSSLYGDLSPQRMREWIAYHVRLFGERSHFVIHDAGGVHEEVLGVLKPWMDKGYVTLQDIREQERFDGYYHNQFLVVNDCLHRYRFVAKWMFFFDVDEFIYLPRKSTIGSLLGGLSDYSQFTIEQMPMSNKLCLSKDLGKTERKWGFEKLVYRDVKRGIRKDRKYAIQPRNVIATGVHMSQNVVGKTTHKTERRIKYFHYHGTVSERHEPCREFVNSSELTFEKLPYVLDQTLRSTASLVKRFELKTIGSALKRTRQ
ncbi:galactan beta-1,4-galactosyltransferase GALS2-like [Tasmannia lanceolata]|uniref:galactan beta-1,4-galactosyltransferase GALS2-like n=1 Tax=Tasmannia lanceolata TaxID=3420 RepID=UPI004062A613